MAEAAVSFLLEKLKNVVIEYEDLISGAENEFNLLNTELGLLEAFLKNAAKKATKQDLFREVTMQIRDVVYEVEDTIDVCMTKISQAKARTSRRPALSDSSKRISLAQEVKFIREEMVLPVVNDAKLKLSAMQIDDDDDDDDDGSGGVEDPSSKLITFQEKRSKQKTMVGMEDEVEGMIGYLRQQTPMRLDVISLIGSPGLGKSTLAWKIYQNESMSYQFPTRIWICVSQMSNMREVLLKILTKFMASQDASELSDDQLVRTVRACLENEKFLLFLDDLRSVVMWDQIKVVLPHDNDKAKIVITSRFVEVGQHSSFPRRPHQLRYLREEESWDLLQYEVFGNLEDCPAELRGIGKAITIKCGGVPLTIIVTGGILTNLLTEVNCIEEWEKVSENLTAAASRNEYGVRIVDVVALSYQSLPDHMRECFLYLGVFPEDYEIPTKMLSRLWVSEGFIRPREGRSLEETAEENLNELIQRNLLTVGKTNHAGRVKTCRVHNLVRDFCITESKEHNLFQEITVHEIGEAPERFRRLCFNLDISNFLSGSPNGPHVRSFLHFEDQPLEKPEYILAILDGFPKLRILEFKFIKLHQFPSKFMKLIHLRRLTLHIDYSLKILPEAISELWNLQTLVVETWSHSIIMKANIWKMFQLRHLETNAALVLDSEWEGEAGENLQTLNRLSPDSCTEAVSRRAKNLKTLGIYGRLADAFRTRFLEKLHHLEKLKLVNTLIHQGATPEDRLHTLPQPDCFPPNLKRLTLRNTFLDWQHMSTLAMIGSLEVLKLKDNAFVGPSWKVHGYNFPNLQLLLIVNTNLVLWEASAESFPSLRYLVVENCENLMEIPECIGTNLEKLGIERLRHSAVVSAQKIKEMQKGKFAVPFNLNIGPACETK
ncbi:hypothetical protein C2S51_029542 [Perilla frutescens var. frutescens]|nr:hypothetical protein C2S51_029542 [Perilla frutescens var. frutescens]